MDAWYKTYIGLHSLGISIIHGHKLNCRSLIAESGCPFPFTGRRAEVSQLRRAGRAWGSPHQTVDGAPRIGFPFCSVSQAFSPETLHQWFIFPSSSVSSPLHAIYVIKAVFVCLCMCAFCFRFQHTGAQEKSHETFIEDKRSLEAVQRKCRSY